MAEAHLDHPGEIKWFAGHGPAKPVGACPHECPHDDVAVVAWGPDYEHYTLVECTVTEPGGCDRQCRAWTVEHPPPHSESRPKYRTKCWQQIREEARVQ